MKRIIGILALLLATNVYAARYAGRPLVDVLRDLEHRGLHLIYSSEVIQPELNVIAEPRATEPRAILDEVLHGHGLRVVDGPRGTLVIVRDESSPPVRKQPDPVMASTPVTVEQIVVTPSHFGILGSQPEQRQFMSREAVRAIPHFSDDIYRAINRIPGATGNDVSASFNIRGGSADEVEVLLDGVQIYEPFHLKDLFNAFSTLDAETMGSVDIMTGGFPAEFGGRMSGVIDIASLTPTERRTSVGISMLNSRALSVGTFGEGKGQWLFSFRPGYLHQVLKMIDATSGLDPSYYDMLAKLQWQFSDTTVVSANLLAAHDTLTVKESQSNAHASSGDQYVWLNARSAPTPRLFTQNVLSMARSNHARDGVIFQTDETAALNDRRAFNVVALKNDTSFDLTAHQVVKGGVSAKRVSADFHILAHDDAEVSVLHFPEPHVVDRNLSVHSTGTDLSVYAADRITLRPNLVAELGLRADRQSYTPDRGHLSPRLNLGWAPTPSTSIRAAWGRFVQPQGVEELQVADGVTNYFPAQVSTHGIVGVDHRFGNGWSLRAETYQKRLSHLRPRFENLFDPFTLFLEIRPDRVQIAPRRGLARGTELLLRKESDGPWSGWLSYARASVKDDIDGRWAPRSWDQRDAVSFSVNFGLARRWNINVAGVYHSGWPTTSLNGYLTPTTTPGNYQLHLAPGPFNDERFSAYDRIDLRASRSVPIGSGTLSFFVEAMNFFNRANVSRVNYFNVNVDNTGRVTTQRFTESILPLIPSFGVSWEF